MVAMQLILAYCFLEEYCQYFVCFLCPSNFFALKKAHVIFIQDMIGFIGS